MAGAVKDAAITALVALNRRNRVQVGIISHVEGLAARIPAGVLVEPQGGGRSTLRVVRGV